MRAWDGFLEAAFLFTTLSAATLLSDRMAYELGALRFPLLPPPAVAAMFGGGLAAAAAFGFLRRKASSAEVAWQADRMLGTESMYLTAVEVAGGEGGGCFGPALLERAAKESERLEPRRVAPVPPLRHRWAIGLSLGAGAVLALFPPGRELPPKADFVADPLRGPAPLGVRFVETCVGRIAEFRWSFGDGTADADGSVVNHEFVKPGRYSVRLRATGPGGAADRAREFEVLEAGSVIADFVATPAKGRAPLRVEFRNLSFGADRFRWNFGDGSGTSERDPAHTFERPGEHRILLEASGGGRTDHAERKIRVVGPDAPLADFAAFPVKGPAPLEVRFENRSTGEIEGYEWDFGDPIGEPSTEADPVHVYRLPGVYTVRLRARGQGGEDRETKERYVRVENDGDGGGGGSGGGSAEESAALLGTPALRPEIDPIPAAVRTPGTGPMVEKMKNVYTGDRSGGKGVEEPFDQAFGRYRRAAEEAVSREGVPESAREFVRKYFEAIRP